LHIVVHYELGDSSYLAYTIRSYKRASKKVGNELKVESLLLKVILSDPRSESRSKNAVSWKKIITEIEKIESSNYEKQLLKYFDFCSWIKEQYVRDRSGI